MEVGGFLGAFESFGEIRKYLVHITEEDAVVLLERLTRSTSCKKILFKDFLETIMPFTPSSSKAVTDTSSPGKSSVIENQEWLLTQIYEREINAYYALESLKSKLVNIEGFSVENVFSMIDVAGRGQIDSDALYLFLSASSLHFHEEELLAIFRSCDSNFDGEISPEDIRLAILPAGLLKQKPRSLSPRTVPKPQPNVIKERAEMKRQEEIRKKNQKMYSDSLRTRNDMSPSLKTRPMNFDSEGSPYESSLRGSSPYQEGRSRGGTPTRDKRQQPYQSPRQPLSPNRSQEVGRTNGANGKDQSRSRNQSPLRGRTEHVLSETEVELLPPSEKNKVLNPIALYLKKVAEVEDSLERVKRLLASQDDFSFSRIFSSFSSKGNGVWNSLDLRKFLTAINVFEPESKVALLFRRLKLNKTTALTYDSGFI